MATPCRHQRFSTRMRPAIAAAMKHLLIAAAVSVAAVPALAADPFTVAGVPVDARATSATEAQALATQQGYETAARLLLERLTLDSERAEKGLPPLDIAVVGPLIRGQTIDNERRSNTRYLGDLTIAFNPSGVQQLLRGAGLTMVSSQAQERLIVPVDVLPDSARAAEIRANRYKHALTPLRAPRGPDGFLFSDGTPGELGLRAGALVRESGLQRALLVYGDGRVVELGPDGETRDLGRSLARAVANLEREFKESTAVPSGELTSSTVSILYSTLAEWQRLQRAINTSAQVRDARLDAVAKDGALMTIAYGDFARLQSEMRQKGVIIERDPELGLVIRG